MASNKRYMNVFEDEKGATSVLVILMMIVLVSLGYFAVASANSNIKLSYNALDWNNKYFDLDKEGENFVADVDNALYKAQIQANEYFTSEAYTSLTHKDLPIETHMEFYRGYSDTLDEASFFADMMDKVYFFYAEKQLQAIVEDYPDVYILANSDGNFISSIVCDLSLKHEQAPEFHLDISVTLNYYSKFGYAWLDEDYSVGRYKISNWSQWQNQPNEGGEIKVWDGVITP